MSKGDNNWTQKETQKELRKRAVKVLNTIHKERKDKKYKLIKISDSPLTFKEVEIKD